MSTCHGEYLSTENTVFQVSDVTDLFHIRPLVIFPLLQLHSLHWPCSNFRIAGLQHDILELKKQLDDARTSGRGGEDNFGNILSSMRADHDKVGPALTDSGPGCHFTHSFLTLLQTLM